MYLVPCNPLGQELHVEGAVPMGVWDLCHWDPEGRLDADPCAGIVVEAGDLDRLLVVGIAALLPHLASRKALFTEQVLLITRGADCTWLWMLAALAPTSCPISAVDARLATRLVTESCNCECLLSTTQLKALPPGQCPSASASAVIKHKRKTFNCHWVPFWPSLQWYTKQPFHITCEPYSHV